MRASSTGEVEVGRPACRADLYERREAAPTPLRLSRTSAMHRLT